MFDSLTKKVSNLFSYFSSSNKFSQQSLEQAQSMVEEILLDADVPFQMAKEVAQRVAQGLSKGEHEKDFKMSEQVKVILYKELVSLMGGDSAENTPTPVSFEQELSDGGIILMAGLQGSGKTTTIAKLAHRINQNAHDKKLSKPKIFTTSLDFNRPAAIAQLHTLAKRGGLNFVAPEPPDMIASVHKAIAAHKNGQGSHLIVDTAGRLQIDNEMMTQLQEVVSTLQPQHKILVLDSMTGQESINVAKAFDQILDISGAILSKADSDSKGGAALAFFHSLKKPVFFLGTGEAARDLENFVPKRIASRMVGEGDIETLTEQLDRAIQTKGINNQDAYQKLQSGSFNLEDFYQQLNVFSSLGSISKIVSYIPGMGAISKEQLAQGEKDLKNVRALIDSMTLKERRNPGILNHSRKKRIAKGAGKSTHVLDQMLNKFEESKRFAKLLGKGKNLKDIFSGRM